MANCNKPALCFSDTDSRAEILRLRRRFLKDREKLSLIYAKKGVVEQKLEKVCIFFKNLIVQNYLLHTKEINFLPDTTEAALYDLKLFMNRSLLLLI